MVIAWPAAVVVVVATRPAWLSVAESMLTLLDELDGTACWAPDAAESPATPVTADACVRMVLAEALMAPNENDGAGGAFIGNEPAGQIHWQLHPPLLAACSADVAFPASEPAISVTAAPATEVVVVPMRPSFVSEAVFTEDDVSDEPLAELKSARKLKALPFAVAVGFDPLAPPATTVTRPDVASLAAAPLDEPLLASEPACTDTVTAEAPTLDEPLAKLLVEVAFPSEPARTVTADAFAAIAETDALLSEATSFGVVVPFPDPWA